MTRRVLQAERVQLQCVPTLAVLVQLKEGSEADSSEVSCTAGSDRRQLKCNESDSEERVRDAIDVGGSAT